jgi:hypothetical protein
LLFNLTTSSNEIGNIVNFLKFCKLNLNFISVIAKDKERLSKVKKKKKKKKKKKYELFFVGIHVAKKHKRWPARPMASMACAPATAKSHICQDAD